MKKPTPWPTILVHESQLQLPYREYTLLTAPYFLLSCAYDRDDDMGRFIKLMLQRVQANRFGLRPIVQAELPDDDRISPYIAEYPPWLDYLFAPFDARLG